MTGKKITLKVVNCFKVEHRDICKDFQIVSLS